MGATLVTLTDDNQVDVLERLLPEIADTVPSYRDRLALKAVLLSLELAVSRKHVLRATGSHASARNPLGQVRPAQPIPTQHRAA